MLQAMFQKKMCHFSWKWEWSAHLHNMAWLYCWQNWSKGVQSLGHAPLPAFFAQHGFFASCCRCPGHIMRKVRQTFSLRGLKIPLTRVWTGGRESNTVWWYLNFRLCPCISSGTEELGHGYCRTSADRDPVARKVPRGQTRLWRVWKNTVACYNSGLWCFITALQLITV